MEEDPCRGVVHCFVWSYPYLLFLLFGIQLSLHPITFLMFFILAPQNDKQCILAMQLGKADLHLCDTCEHSR